MQRHGQQGRRSKDALAAGRGLDGEGRQQRKHDKVCQPPQRQRRGKAQVQKIRKEHRTAAGQIQQRVLVSLQLVVFLMTGVGGVGGGEQRVGELLPGEDGGIFVLQKLVGVGLPAETGGGGHLAHLPVIVGDPIGPLGG